MGATAAAEGLSVSIPDLTSVAGEPNPIEAFCQLAAHAGRTMDRKPLVVGHSGAGAFLPDIGAAISNVAGLIFVDAVVPPTVGAHQTSPAMQEMLDSVTEDGCLRRWIDWWPEEAIAELLPNEEDRTALSADMPRLPRSFYNHDVPVPPRWSQHECAYLRLGDAYDAELQEAIDRGWPTARFESNHLAPLTQPDTVLGGVLRLAGELA